jgi:hypothetical protein
MESSANLVTALASCKRYATICCHSDTPSSGHQSIAKMAEQMRTIQVEKT